MAIVNNLRLQFGRGRRRYETSVEAYDLYLHTRALPQRASRDARTIIGPYQQVIAKDASFAPAYAGLTAAYAASSFQDFYDHSDELIQMRAAAEKAIRLDPLLGGAHQALGMVYAPRWALGTIRKELPSCDRARAEQLAGLQRLTNEILLPLGRIKEGVQEMQTAEKTDPLSPWIRSNLAWVLLYAKRYGSCRPLPEGSELRASGPGAIGSG